MPSTAREFDAWQLELHGHRVIYRTAGSGPPVVLIHGMVNSSRHWEQVALRLADAYTVIAPDLIGHGDSATPRGDYSLGAHAAGIRDMHRAVPGSRFEVLPRAAHFPHLEDPDGLATVLRDFVETTLPAPIEDADWGEA